MRVRGWDRSWGVLWGVLSQGVLAAALFGLAAANTGCGSCANGVKVAFPSGDATAPTLAALDAHFPSQATVSVTNTSGPMTVTITGTPVITLLGAGEDPEASGPVEIWIIETKWSGGSGGNPGLGGGPAASSATPKPSAQEGCTRNLASLNVDIAQKTQGLTQYRIEAWAVAKNSAGASTKSQKMVLNWP